jgi:hypothetical protein
VIETVAELDSFPIRLVFPTLRLFILCDLSQGVASLNTVLFGLKPIQRKGVYQVLSRMKIEDTIR